LRIAGSGHRAARSRIIFVESIGALFWHGFADFIISFIHFSYFHLHAFNTLFNGISYFPCRLQPDEIDSMIQYTFEAKHFI
jgi:hypothetical protein